MCKSPTKLIFCSCVNENSKEEVLTKSNWILNRFKGFKNATRYGELVPPNRDLGNGLRIEEIIFELNTRNCFDFDYNPQEKDTLHIDNKLTSGEYRYSNLVYQEGKWEAGENKFMGRALNPVTSIVENIASGKIQVSKIHPNELASHYNERIGHVEVEKIYPLLKEQILNKTEFLDFCELVRVDLKYMSTEEKELVLLFLNGIFNGGQFANHAEEAICKNLNFKNFSDEAKIERIFENNNYSKKELYQMYLDKKFWIS